MIYVFDTSSFQQLFVCYSHHRFPSVWKKFDNIVSSRRVTSIEQVFNEIESRDKKNGELEWAQKHKELFPSLSHNDSLFLNQIYSVPEYRHVVPTDQRDANTAADAFLIARAKAVDGMVITQERQRNNRVTIPAICRYFGILCGTLDHLMQRENWTF